MFTSEPAATQALPQMEGEGVGEGGGGGKGEGGGAGGQKCEEGKMGWLCGLKGGYICNLKWKVRGGGRRGQPVVEGDHIWGLLRPKHFLKWKVRGCWWAAGGKQRGKRWEGEEGLAL